MVNTPLSPLPSRLWERLVLASGIPRDTRWANLSRSALHHLVQQLCRTRFEVSGKSLNQDEFVTCGGVPLNEVNFKTMESRVCPGLYFGGELLDLDGLTGGFNFQAAWTTGWIAVQRDGCLRAGRPVRGAVRRHLTNEAFAQPSGVNPMTMSNFAVSSPIREFLSGTKSTVTESLALGSWMLL